MKTSLGTQLADTAPRLWTPACLFCQAALLLTWTHLKFNSLQLSASDPTALVLLTKNPQSFESYYNFHNEMSRASLVCQGNSSPLKGLHEVSLISSSTRHQRCLKKYARAIILLTRRDTMLETCVITQATIRYIYWLFLSRVFIRALSLWSMAALIRYAAQDGAGTLLQRRSGDSFYTLFLVQICNLQKMSYTLLFIRAGQDDWNQYHNNNKYIILELKRLVERQKINQQQQLIKLIH